MRLPGLVATLLAVAAAPAPSPTPAGNASPSATARAATPSPNPHRTIVGLVTNVDAATRRVTVAETVRTGTAKGATVVLVVDAGTKLLRGTRPATFEELKADDHVVARYLDGKDGARALSVRIAEAP